MAGLHVVVPLREHPAVLLVPFSSVRLPEDVADINQQLVQPLVV